MASWVGLVGAAFFLWLATGTPAMLRAQHLAGPAGVAVFTITWFVAASGLEAVIALAVARSGRRIGHRGQGAFTGLSAVLFVALAGLMVARSVIR